MRPESVLKLELIRCLVDQQSLQALFLLYAQLTARAQATAAKLGEQCFHPAHTVLCQPAPNRQIVNTNLFGNFFVSEPALGKTNSYFTLFFLRGRIECASVFFNYARNISYLFGCRVNNRNRQSHCRSIANPRYSQTPIWLHPELMTKCTHLCYTLPDENLQLEL